MKALSWTNGLKWLTMASIIAAFAIHFSTDYALGGASPLALLITGLAGWLLQQKAALVANLLLLFAGGALLLFPFLNVAPLVYTFLSLPLLVLGVTQSVTWWQHEHN